MLSTVSRRYNAGTGPLARCLTHRGDIRSQLIEKLPLASPSRLPELPSTLPGRDKPRSEDGVARYVLGPLTPDDAVKMLVEQKREDLATEVNRLGRFGIGLEGSIASSTDPALQTGRQPVAVA